MVETLFSIGRVIAVLVLVVIIGSWVYSWAAEKYKLGGGATASKASAFANQGAFLVALGAPYVLAKMQGDTIILDLLSKCRIQSATWDDDVVVPTPPTTPFPVANGPTLVSLAAEVAALKDQVALLTGAKV